MSLQKRNCARVEKALRQGKLAPQEESHFFVCRSCRREARLAAAWKAIPPLQQSETAVPIDDSFVEGVLRRVREDRGRRLRLRLGVAAAAALLFSFAAGLGQRASASPADDADDSYTQILTPSTDSLLPD